MGNIIHIQFRRTRLPRRLLRDGWWLESPPVRPDLGMARPDLASPDGLQEADICPENQTARGAWAWRVEPCLGNNPDKPLNPAAEASANVAHSILVVDDDPHIRDVVRFAFEKSGMAISIAQDGKEALRQFDRDVHDLVVLDIGMPEMDGLEVCRQIRKTSDTPILFLSARDEEIDRVLGLEIGGDDYVTKPFSPRELVARVNAILRRTRHSPAATAAAKEMTHRGLSINPDARTAAFRVRRCR
jgi:CheY-like chemotaxis protein